MNEATERPPGADRRVSCCLRIKAVRYKLLVVFGESGMLVRW